MDSFNPFSTIVNFTPKHSLSRLYDILPHSMTPSDMVANIKTFFLFPSWRPDVNPRKGMFLWQRDYFAYLRHRKRVPAYFAATFGLHTLALHALARKDKMRADGSGMLRLLRGAMYKNHDLPTVYDKSFVPQQMQSNSFHVSSAAIPYHSAIGGNTGAIRDYALKTPVERKEHVEMMKRIFTGGYEAYSYKSHWFTQMERGFLPVSNDPAVNKTAYEATMRGIEAVVEAKPLSEAKKHFAVVENLRESALLGGKAKIPAPDGSYDLRFATKATIWKVEGLWKRTLNRVFRPFDFGRYHHRLRYLPHFAVAHYVAWLVLIGLLAAPFEDAKLRANTDLLATWGPLDDNRPFAERKTEWENTLKGEAARGEWVFRDWGWLQGYNKFVRHEDWFYYDC